MGLVKLAHVTTRRGRSRAQGAFVGHGHGHGYGHEERARLVTSEGKGKRKGAKTDSGFYRKEGKEIRTLDWKTLEYRERVKPKIPTVDGGKGLEDVGERIQLILKGKDKAAEFLVEVIREG